MPDLPTTLDGVRVETVTTGIIVAALAADDRFPRPVPIGVSAGLADVATGTLGARVTDRHERLRALEQPRLRGRQHGEHRRPDHPARPDDGRWHRPGRSHRDARRLPDDRLQRRHEHDGRRDRADDDRRRRHRDASRTATARRARTTVPAFIGMGVQKYGRTTGLTARDRSHAVNVSVDVCYFPLGELLLPGYEARFVNQFSIVARPVQRRRGLRLAHRHAGRATSRSGCSSPAATDSPSRTRSMPCCSASASRSTARRRADGPPGAPTGLSARRRRRAGRALLDAHRASTAARRSRATRCIAGTSPDPTSVLTANASARRRATWTRCRTNGTTYYYKVSARTPTARARSRTRPRRPRSALVPPVEPLPDRRQLRPR